MLRPLQPKLLFVVLLSIAIAAALNAPASAASPSTTATSDLIPGPPLGPWFVDTEYTGPMTMSAFYGSPTASAPGFSDAYRKAWYEPEVALEDRVAHYNSVVWAAYALSSFKVGAQRGNTPTATSVRSISGFGPGAFEVTYPAGTDGYQWDEIYFAVGDYVAWVSLGATGALARGVLLDQSSRQFASLPAATAELHSIRTGILATVVGVALVTFVLVAGILLIVVLSLRRPATVGVDHRALETYSSTVQQSASPQFSPDGKWWWDGQQWGSAISSDGLRSWNGAAWVPVRKMFMVDYATHSIFAAGFGVFCGLLWPYGFWCGYLAYKELPHRRTQAIVGMVLNAIGYVWLVLVIIYRYRWA